MKSSLSRPLRCLTLLTILAGTIHSSAEVSVAGLFGDNMVLQRETAAPIWGTAAPQEKITVKLGDQTLSTTAGADGQWKTSFKGLKPGGPFTLTVTGATNTVTFNNVDVGDVWICSGQSNMYYSIHDSKEIDPPNDPDLRYLDFSNNAIPLLEPTTDIPANRKWVTPDAGNAAQVTAVGYHFAKNLRKELGIPIGFIRTSVGGTPIEAWTPKEALESIPEMKDPVEKETQDLKDQPAQAEKFPADFKAWTDKYGRSDSGNKGFAAGWAATDADTKDWTSTPKPKDWALTAIPNGGVVWFRKTVSIPADAVGHDFNLDLGGRGPSVDTAYFNGEQVGSESGLSNPPFFWGQRIPYRVPAKLVKAGDNVIVLRAVCQNPQAADVGVNLNLKGVDNNAIPKDWLIKVESSFSALPAGADKIPMPPFRRAPSVPTTLYNGMINPLIPYGIKGAIWYQGETNGGQGFAYRTFLPLMIQSWRERWMEGDFPFYIVQLANYGGPQTVPVEGGGWAEVREAELITSQKTPNTGLAVIVDIGEAANIHPLNKHDVGYRLAEVALAKTYGKTIEYSGPIYNSMTVEGGKIRLKFTHVGGGLVAKDGPLQRFAIAGEDKKWVVATATIEGDTIVVSSPDVPNPVAVRYAWANNPEGCNLYNKDGFPASPFRTDDWPNGSEGHWR